MGADSLWLYVKHLYLNSIEDDSVLYFSGDNFESYQYNAIPSGKWIIKKRTYTGGNIISTLDTIFWDEGEYYVFDISF